MKKKIEIQGLKLKNLKRLRTYLKKKKRYKDQKLKIKHQLD